MPVSQFIDFILRLPLIGILQMRTTFVLLISRAFAK